MNFWQSFIKFLQLKGETPTLFGWYHLLCLTLSIGATVYLCVFRKKDSSNTVKNVTMVTGIAVILLEVCKLLILGTDPETKVFQFPWYYMPWQFCSVPMYVSLLVGIIRKGKVHDSLCAFLCTYAVFAGLAVMVYPGDVYHSYLWINIQTMVCHGTMLPIAGYLLATGHVKLEHRTVLKALPVFAAAVAVAVGINELTFRLGRPGINMFFISPHCDPSLPVYSLVQQVVPYPWSLVIYILGFTAAAYLMLLGAMGIARLCSAGKSKAAAA